MSASIPARWARRALAGLAAVVMAAGLAACTGGGGSAPHDPAAGPAERGDELVVQFRGTPISLDPASQGTASGSIFTVLAYDPLIYQAPDGSLQPSLATEWGFTDDTLKTFELTLREGVEFSSGEPLTAEAVKNSVDYFLSVGGGNVTRVGPISEVEAVDDLTVRFHYDSPFSDAPLSMTQTLMMGNIIGPTGLADPESLLLSMDGTGQYTYNTEESVDGSSYVYDRNEGYWNPEAQMWERVEVQIISDPNAVLNAASTGQIDFGLGSALFADAAVGAGLELATAPFYNWQIRLLDVNGEINPALADERVRQAIALAIDRESIVEALGGEYMAPSGQFVVEGTEGYDESLGFEYDPERARELLAEAGYEDGFSMTILDSSVQDAQSRIAQAVSESLGDVGIDVTLEVDSVGIPSFNEKSESKKYEASIWASNGDVGNAYRSFRAAGSASNPWGFLDDEMEALYEKSLTVEGGEREAVYREMSARWGEVGYTVPILTEYYVNYIGPDVTNVKSSPANPVMLPVGPEPEYNWQPAS